jgi:hypothetical protein
MKPLLIAALVLAFQALVFSCFRAGSVITRGGRGAVVLLSWLAASVVVSLFAFAAVKAVCHECLTAPSVAVCPHSNHAFDWEIQSKRIGGYIKERQYGGCYFYWHENNMGSEP